MTLLFYTYCARQAADNADTNVHLQTHEDVQVSVAVVTNSTDGLLRHYARNQRSGSFIFLEVLSLEAFLWFVFN